MHKSTSIIAHYMTLYCSIVYSYKTGYSTDRQKKILTYILNSCQVIKINYNILQYIRISILIIEL